MKKTILIFTLFVGLLISSSGFNEYIFSTTPGSFAPIVPDTEINDIISQSENNGQYVLLTFWTSTDGEARKSINDYSAWIHDKSTDRLDLLSINFDKSENLFREIVKRDGIGCYQHFNVSGTTARHITDTFNLSKGYGSILIAPDGRVVCVNPTRDQLNEVLS